MLTVQYCDVHNRCRGYRWNIAERAISRAATRPSIIGDRISSRFSEFACCEFDIALTSLPLSPALSLGGWFDALINDRVDNVARGVLPIGYRVEWRDIPTFFSSDSCHWFRKVDDFIPFSRVRNFEWRARDGFKIQIDSIGSLSKLCNAFACGLTYFLGSGTMEDGWMDTVVFSGSDIGRFDVSER